MEHPVPANEAAFFTVGDLRASAETSALGPANPPRKAPNGTALGLRPCQREMAKCST